MKLETARKFIEGLQEAIEQAEAEGRDYLNTGDVTVFAAMDDAARAELDAAIQSASRGEQ